MEDKQIAESLGNATKLLLSIAFELKERGAKISVSEIIDSLRLMYTYAFLNKNITLNDLYKIIRASLVKKPEYQDLYDKIWEKKTSLARAVPEEVFRNLWHEVLQRLHTLHTDFGKKVSLSRVEDAKNRQEYMKKISSYIELRKAGLIEKYGSREYIVSRKKALMHLKRVAREYNAHITSLASLADKLWINEPKGKWDRDFLRIVLRYSELNPDTLKNMSDTQLDRLLSVSNSATSRNKRIIDKEIASRLSNGRLENSRNIENIIDDLISHNRLSLSMEELSFLLSRKPELIEKIMNTSFMNYEKLRSLLDKLPSQESREIIRRLLRKQPGYINLLLKDILRGNLSPEILPEKQSLKKISREADLLMLVASIMHNVDNYISTGNAGYLDMIQDQLFKLQNKMRKEALSGKGIQGLDKLREALYILGTEADREIGIAKFLVKTQPIHKAFTNISRLYSTATSIETRKRLIRIALRAWRLSLVKYRGGHLVYKKTRVSYRTPRLDYRSSIYNMIRLTHVYKYIARHKQRRIVLVVDYSGSMQKYSIYALLMASALLPRVKRITLFSQHPENFDVRGRSRSISRLVEILISKKFEGLTDIVAALKSSTRRTRPGILVLVSDLKQTVKRSIGVEEIVKQLILRGWRIKVVVPPDYNVEASERLKSYGAKIYVLSDVSRIKPIAQKIFS